MNLDSVDMLSSLEGESLLELVNTLATQRGEHRRSPLLGSQRMCQMKKVAAENWDRTLKTEL